MSLGNNTDIKALASLAQYAKQVLILGGGGVARAAIVAMQSVGARVYVATRRIEQAEQLKAGADEKRQIARILRAQIHHILDRGLRSEVFMDELRTKPMGKLDTAPAGGTQRKD